MKKIVLVFIASLLLTGFGFAETAEDVIKVFTDLDRVPDYNYSTILIDNIEANGSVEHMIIKQYGGGNNGLQNTVFDFQSPARAKGTRILQAEHIGRSDDRWVYLPELRTIRRIAMSERYKSFVGSELTYNDMTIRELDEDTNEMLSESDNVTVNGVTYNCWKIKSTPIKLNEVEYGYRISWFDKKTYVPVRVEFYDKKNAKKMIKLSEVETLEMVKGVTGIEYPLRRSTLVTNLVTNRKSRVSVKEFKFDEKISDSYFTQSWLGTGKAK